MPDYVNELFAKIARENGFKKFSVESESGSKPGDGFTSEILRVKISEESSPKRLEMMCKMAPTNENVRKEFSTDSVFKQEAIFYQKFMPMLAKFQEEKRLPKCDQFQAYPKCYGVLLDDEYGRYIIALEDLRPLEFVMWDKTKLPPIENVRLTMRELGKYHGLSIALNDQRPVEFAEFKNLDNMLKLIIKSKNMADMFSGSYTRAAESLKQEDHKQIVRHFNNDVPKIFSELLEKSVSGRVGVICHGMGLLLLALESIYFRRTTPVTCDISL